MTTTEQRGCTPWQGRFRWRYPVTEIFNFHQCRNHRSEFHSVQNFKTEEA
jgi:hypothetical protein